MKFCIKIIYFFLNFVHSCSHNDPDIMPDNNPVSPSSVTADPGLSWKLRVVTFYSFQNDVTERFEGCKSECSKQKSCSLALLTIEGCFLISLIDTYSQNFEEIDFKEIIRWDFKVLYTGRFDQTSFLGHLRKKGSTRFKKAYIRFMAFFQFTFLIIINSLHYWDRISYLRSFRVTFLIM